MFAKPARSVAFYIICAISMAYLIGATNPAQAEKSLKKFEHKLHKAEKGTGKVLKFTGKVALIGVGLCFEAVLDSLDDDPQERGDFRTRHTSPPHHANPPAQPSSKAK